MRFIQPSRRQPCLPASHMPLCRVPPSPHARAPRVRVHAFPSRPFYSRRSYYTLRAACGRKSCRKESRKSCLRPRVPWNETAGTRHLRDANKDRSPNMVFSCQVARQTPPSCYAQGHVQGTRAESMFMCAGHSLRASTELHGTRRMFRASVFLWRFQFHFLDLLFCRQNSFYNAIIPLILHGRNYHFNEFKRGYFELEKPVSCRCSWGCPSSTRH